MPRQNFRGLMILCGLALLIAVRWRDTAPQNDTPQVQGLARRLKSPDLCVRDEAALSLGKQGPDAVPAVLEILHDGDSQVRANAVEALGNMGSAAAAAAPALAEAVHDEDMDVRDRAAMSLQRIGPAGAAVTPRLMEFLKDDEEEIRYSAALALYWIKPPFGVAPALVIALRDQNRFVRLYAAKTLAKIAPDAEKAVRKMRDCQIAQTLATWRAAQTNLDAMDTKYKFDSTPYADFQAAIRHLQQTLQSEKQARRAKGKWKLAV